jgi:hypothetical protein
MKIWLYTVTFNEAKILPFFLRHYEQFCERIIIFDDKSTDGTRDIIKACPVAELREYPHGNGLDDRDFITLAQNTYREARGRADWVIWVDPDELLYHRHLVPLLADLKAKGVQVPGTRGFQMISERFPTTISQIYHEVNEGIEDPSYAKSCVFQPECEMNWDPGKHAVHGTFNRGEYAGLKLLHFRYLGVEYLRDRHERNYARCSKANIASGLGVGVYPGHQGHMSEPWFKTILAERRPVLNLSTFHELVRVIHHSEDPYANWTSTGQPQFQPTWGSEHPWFHEIIEHKRPQVIVEVGSFLGRSAAHMGAKLKELQLDGAIICIDTWLGDDDHWTIPEVRKLMYFENGRPKLYESFRANMQLSKLDRHVIPLPIDSISGARLLSKLGVRADFIYIDGGHVEGEVYRDLVNYWSILKSGGVMMMDDYGADPGRFAGLMRDVDRFLRERNLTGEFNGDKARVTKP